MVMEKGSGGAVLKEIRLTSATVERGRTKVTNLRWEPLEGVGGMSKKEEESDTASLVSDNRSCDPR